MNIIKIYFRADVTEKDKFVNHGVPSHMIIQSVVELPKRLQSGGFNDAG